MVKRITQYLTKSSRPIYSENGNFYYKLNNGTTWRRLLNTAPIFSWESRAPLPNPYNNVNLNYEGTIANLKANYNWAARTIQKVVRNRRKRKAATTIQKHVRGTQLRSRAGWHNPHTPVGYLALMLRTKRYFNPNT